MEDKIIVVYKSSTGFTKKYAEWIAEEVKGTLADHRTVTAQMLSEYEVVVFGSRAHAGMIDGYKKARELFQKSAAGKIVLFVTGATPNAAEDMIRDFDKNAYEKEFEQAIAGSYDISDRKYIEPLVDYLTK